MPSQTLNCHCSIGTDEPNEKVRTDLLSYYLTLIGHTGHHFSPSWEAACPNPFVGQWEGIGVYPKHSDLIEGT